jgi:O-antigen/teichoic acid export membrane protein
MRGQVGGLLNLLSLRLDFAILGAIAGPSTLGIYAVASKFAELPRVIPLSITYVLYPRLRREEPAEAARSARRLLPRAGAMTALSTVPAGLAALVLIEPVFGHEFAGATVPAIILLVGVAGDGCGAVASGYLYGSGRPGLNSLGLGAGVAVTVVLDALLIPAHRAIGAAVASSFAYLTATTVLVAIFVARVRSVPRRETVAPDAPAPLAPPRSDQLTSPQWALPRVAQGEHP